MGPFERNKGVSEGDRMIPEVTLLDCNAADGATVRGFRGTFSSLGANDFRLSRVFIKFENIRADLGAYPTADALFSIDLHTHGDKPPPPNGRF
jgi:hypothetical protein